MGPRYALYNRFIVSAGGDLFHLAPGVYQVSVEDTTYLPERWGTLINFRSSEKYGGVIFLSNTGKLHHREYTLENNTWYNDWKTPTTTADYIGEYTVSIIFSSSQSNGYSISTMIPLPGADTLTITPVSLRLIDGSGQVTSGIEIDRKNKVGFSVSYYGVTFQGKGAYLVFRASK